MKLKKIIASTIICCLLISSTPNIEAKVAIKDRVKRALAGSFLGGLGGGALGFGIGVLSVLGVGACCPCCIFLPVIAYSVIGVGAGAATGGVVGAVTAKDGAQADIKADNKATNKTKKIKNKKIRRSKRNKKNKAKVAASNTTLEEAIDESDTIQANVIGDTPISNALKDSENTTDKELKNFS